MKAKNQYQKYKYYLLKKKEIYLHGLQESQKLGKKTGPKVVLNSLPKSGTHLLESLFFQLPLMRHCGKRTLKIETQNPVESKLPVISSLKKGQFLLSHMQFHDSIIKTVNENNIKIIHLIRDPRDVLLSHLNYIEKMDTTQKSHKLIRQYNTRFDKLKAMIEGKHDVLEPFSEVLDKFQPWLNQPEVLCVKFEHLIGPNGGGSKELQVDAVKNISNFISVDINKDELESICNSIFSSKSSTFNKGKIGNWKNTLSEEEKVWLNNVLQVQIINYLYNND
ncbi:sulfotransferase domain-containing protein [Xanthomarina sp. F2636L]|uniref:sulfotransferase domain-containing protein n=1 Tax=Xanthomarina sp. F2636L TaxID=2996018 RepID=UPI00225E2152|nr:sulfotransferase domain-containing protein [Xanthomarina sp. F2636L]MCX7551334.1 sulfotransferase domain-containing protein [Xanthomarina sp. F2636L]